MNNDKPLIMPTGVLEIINRLNASGFEAYAVGGCVRDSIIGKEPQDWDITTSAEPKEIKRIFSDGRTADTGIKYGTVSVFNNEEIYEVTTFRSERKYEDFRHPSELLFSHSLREDLARRDFTMNAVAYHPLQGITDPFNGKRDINEKIIRCVGNPFERLREDPLRILRGIRFSMQLGFEIEAETKAAIKELSPLLTHISVERIKSEIEKMLTAEFFSTATVKEYNIVFSSCAPFLVCENLCTELVGLYNGNDINIKWALFLLQQPDLSEICNAFKFSNVQKRNICELVTHVNRDFCDEVTVRHLINRIGIEQVRRLAEMQLVCRGNAEAFKKIIKKIVSENQCCTMKQLAVNGKILIENGFCSGRETGAMLKKLLDCVLDGKLLNEENALLTYAKSQKKVQ